MGPLKENYNMFDRKYKKNLSSVLHYTEKKNLLKVA